MGFVAKPFVRRSSGISGVIATHTPTIFIALQRSKNVGLPRRLLILRSRCQGGFQTLIPPHGSSNPATPASQCGLPTRPPSYRERRAIPGHFSHGASSPRTRFQEIVGRLARNLQPSFKIFPNYERLSGDQVRLWTARPPWQCMSFFAEGPFRAAALGQRARDYETRIRPVTA